MKPINMKKPVKKTSPFFKWLVRLLTKIFRKGKVYTIKKVNFETVEGPYFIVSTHASLMDFAFNEAVTHPQVSTYITSLEELVGREWLMRGVGCYPKRKYTKDTIVVRQSLRSIRELKQPVTIYPEARFSFAGVREKIDSSMGKLVKMAGVPVVVLICYGDFTYEPQWDKKNYRDNPFEIIATCVATKEEVEKLSADEIQKRIEDAFQYDEYEWLYQNDIHLKVPYRANNIHRILYKCPHCGKDYAMHSEGNYLWCKECGVKYFMNELSRLECENAEAKFTKVPDWYRWEKSEVQKEIDNETYSFEVPVRLEHLDNAQRGFRDLGNVTFKHDLNGLHLHGTLKDGSSFDFDNAPENTPSLHVEYNFCKKGTVKRGQIFDINTMKDTWFAYPLTDDVVVTKVSFAVEALHDKVTGEKKFNI